MNQDAELPIFSQASIFCGKKNVKYHSHPGVELILVCHGSCDVTIENKTFTLTKGKVLVIAPEAEHNQICHKETKNLFVVFTIKPTFFSPRSRLIDIGNDKFCYRFMQTIADLSKEKHYNLCDGIIFALLKHLKELENDLTNIAGNDSRLLRVLEIINQNFHTPMNITDISREVGVSPSYLRSLFSQKYKISLMQYLQNIRMAHARELLLLPYWNVTEIAEQCGYQNANYFCRLFRKVHNCSPLQYRQRLSCRKNLKNIRL